MSTIQKIDKDSGAGVDNRLSFFQLPATNVGIVRSAYKELLPLNALNLGRPLYLSLFWRFALFGFEQDLLLLGGFAGAKRCHFW